jgi:hypothetical protein
MIMERAERARLRTGTNHRHHSFRVIPGSVHEHKRDELRRKRETKEQLIVVGLSAVFILAASGIVYLAIQFGS